MKDSLYYEAKPTSRQFLRQIAKIARDYFGLKSPKIYVVRFLEYQMTADDPELQIEIVDEFPGEPKKYGDYNPLLNIIRTTRDIYEKAVAGDGFARFTIMHECCHKLLITPDNLVLCKSREKIVCYRDPEWQANCLAGELLMPYDYVKNKEIEEIMDLCGVTYSAAQLGYKHSH